MNTYTCYAKSKVIKHPATELFLSVFLYTFYHENYFSSFYFPKDFL